MSEKSREEEILDRLANGDYFAPEQYEDPEPDFRYLLDELAEANAMLDWLETHHFSHYTWSDGHQRWAPSRLKREEYPKRKQGHDTLRAAVRAAIDLDELKRLADGVQCIACGRTVVDDYEPHRSGCLVAQLDALRREEPGK